jgi:hypothetical protein
MNISMAIHPVVEIQTGISSRSVNSIIDVYPNPAEGNVYVEVTGEVGKIEVVTLQGDVVAHFAMDTNQMKRVLDLSHLPPGAYLIRLKGSRSSTVRKIILH